MEADRIVISKGASADIAALTQGEERSKVALRSLEEAIKDGSLTEEMKEYLKAIVARFEVKVAVSTPLETNVNTEAKLRQENRIQDDPAILSKLGYEGNLPGIPAKLLEECARTSGTLVLKFKTTVTDYQAKLNAALGPNKESLHLFVGDRAKALATTNDEPMWINVPNTVKHATLSLPKTAALKSIPGSDTCDPMDTVLMLGYNNLKAGQQLPGFKNKWTFTNQKNMLVGSLDRGISVGVHAFYGADGYYYVGLAPRLASESKN